jgi:hypothetical protein
MPRLGRDDVRILVRTEEHLLTADPFCDATNFRKMVKIIGFHGKKHSGKNTSAEALTDAKELAFADPT